MKIIIIGGGIGGLATAALLGKKGHSVIILEMNKEIGGRARVFKEKGFTFDMGPSWYLMPDVFKRFYSLFGKKPQDFLNLIPLNPQYRVYFEKGDYIDVKRKFEENLRTFQKIDPESRESIEQYVLQSEFIYKSAMKNYVYRNYNSVLDFLDKKLIFEGGRLGLQKNLYAFVSSYVKNEKIKKVLLYSSVFLGISPKKAPALFALMSYIDFKMGVFYPLGGIGSVIESLKKLCEQNNVVIKTKQKVTKIVVKEGKACGVMVGNVFHESDLVVSNADYPHTEMNLLDKKYQSYPANYWDRKVIAPSAFIIYLGLSTKLKNIVHHTLSFENDWEEHFDEIFKTPQWPKKPSYYICCPSKTDSSVAPKNCENLFILVPIASGIKDTKIIRKKYRDMIIGQVEDLIGEKINDKIMYERIYALNDFEVDYNAYKGTALGLAHTLFQSAAFRVRNKSKKVKGLYFVGQYTQPGIGMPMCLISAELVVEKNKSI